MEFLACRFYCGSSDGEVRPAAEFCETGLAWFFTASIVSVADRFQRPVVFNALDFKTPTVYNVHICSQGATKRLMFFFALHQF